MAEPYRTGPGDQECHPMLREVTALHKLASFEVILLAAAGWHGSCSDPHGSYAN